MPARKRDKKRELTVPDLVLLSLLAEQPMHGYQANAELERRQVRDWAGISRPQIYYSLEKLAKFGLLRQGKDSGTAAGPDRSVFAVTAAGRAALADALEREDWTMQRERPAFLAWLALSWQARPGVAQKQIQLRRRFVASELEREQATLSDVLHEVGHQNHEAVWMLGLVIEQFKSELSWLDKVEGGLNQRASARNPAIAGSDRE